ncbi:DNA cytosine methyltransferase [Tenacibaculum maritimum]|uniref:DNA cytosine methyltransferase n=1 Tax=Tenacibaculum maritimum TaxID=107401 RepID=UPI00388FCD73
MKLLELFSGIGGFSKGFEEAGYKFNNIYFSEVAKPAIANYKYNYPNATYIGSVKHFQQWKNQLGRINILTFGSPCQNFSLAGNRKGLKGRSSSLIHYAIMAIEWFRPDVFIWENVKGAYSSNKGEDFQAIFERLANIDGYRLEKQLLNTSWFLPQNRERIYLIGHLTGRSTPGVFPFRENDKTFVKRKGNQSQTQICTTVGTKMGNRADSTFVIPKKSGTLTAGGNSGGLHSDMTVIPVLTPDRKEKRQNGRRFKENGEAAFTLNCQDKHGIMIKSTHFGPHQQDRFYDDDGLMSCLPSARTEDKIKIQTNNQIRRLTEIECERLQGFKDNWTKFGNYDGTIKPISKTQRYKMLGNAVSVPVITEIARRLKL